MNIIEAKNVIQEKGEKGKIYYITHLTKHFSNLIPTNTCCIMNRDC